MASTSEQAGIVETLIRVLRLAGEGLEMRLRLLSIEARQETIRLVILIAAALIAAIFVFTGWIMLNVWLLALGWEHRAWLGLAIAAGNVLVGTGLLWCLIRRVKAAERPFAASIAEFRADRHLLGREPHDED